MPTTPLQDELEARKRCYLEKIVRGLYGTPPGWDKGAPAGGDGSFCGKLGFQKPSQPGCDQIKRYPLVPPSPDESVFTRLARLELVARDPRRQREVFGWVPPKKNDAASRRAFELALARYWAVPDPYSPPPGASLAESMEELYTLQETADFHANYLLRLIYLYGDTPPHLRTNRTAWRSPGCFDRDVNFPAAVEAQITRNIQAFKYWLDEPFYADSETDDAKRLRQWRATRKTQANRKSDPKAPQEDPSNDDYRQEMTFWSENHQILFATAEYLAGQLWPQTIFRVCNHFRTTDQGKTRPTDLLGRQRMDRARPRILRWLNDRLRFGFSEWNSPGYYDEDFTALFNLADFCLDDEIQTRACMVLDLMLFDLARFTVDGSFAVAAGRAYFEHKNCGYEQSVGDLVEVLFGTRGGLIVERSSTCAGALVTTRRYTVPDALMAIGRDKPAGGVDRSRVSLNFDDAAKYGIGFESDADVLFWWSRGAYFVKQLVEATLDLAKRFHLMKTSPFKDVLPAIMVAARFESATATLNPVEDIENFVRNVMRAPASGRELARVADKASVVTEGPSLTRANLYTWRSEHAMLSSVQNFRPGQMSFQLQACQATLSLEASVWPTYPAAKDKAGLAGSHDGPNWWTGNATTPRVVQMKNAAIIAYEPHTLQYILYGHRTHAWFPKAAFDKGSITQHQGNCNLDGGLWTFGKVGDGYVGLYSAQAPHWTTSGDWAGTELTADGLRNVFILQVGDRAQFGSFEQFVSQVSQARIHVGGLHLVTAGSILTGIFLDPGHFTKDFECSYDIPGGKRLELHYDKGEVHYDGNVLSDDDFPRFENDYVSCGRVLWDQAWYTIKHGTYSLTHDFRANQAGDQSRAKVRRVLNGSNKDLFDCTMGPRPFYVVGHNPNTIADVIAALDAGANAIEPDVNVYEDRQGELCISEVGTLDKDKGGGDDAPSLANYLDDLHLVALERPELSLVVFDCKPKVSAPEHGLKLLQEIRARLTHDTDLNVIISVSSLSYTAIFDTIKGQLGPREGVMIDEEDSPTDVSDFFTKAGIANQCYGNGVAALLSAPTLAPHLRPSIEQACEERAASGRIKFIYVWSVDDPDKMREYIRIGLDGIIAGSRPSAFDADCVALLRAVIQEREFEPLIRLATRNDNPFTPPNSTYGLLVHTGDRWNAGTDARITFTLTGALGSCTKVVDASLIGSVLGKTPGRMERNAWDFVTLQTPDLGQLTSITVSRTDDGNAPDWFLDQIQVRSHRYGASKKAVFNRWIETSQTTERLV